MNKHPNGVVDLLQARISKIEKALCLEGVDEDELDTRLAHLSLLWRVHVAVSNNLNTELVVGGAKGPVGLKAFVEPEMLIIDQYIPDEQVHCFLSFDWIEWYIKTNPGKTPEDAYREACQVRSRQLFPTGAPEWAKIEVKIGLRNPEVVLTIITPSAMGSVL